MPAMRPQGICDRWYEHTIECGPGGISCGVTHRTSRCTMCKIVTLIQCCDQHLRMSDEKATVLVVDDEQRIVEAHRRWLADEFSVLTADGGESALNTIDETVDIVLLDRRMPKCPGMDVLSEIRARELECVVIVVSSAKPEIEIIKEQFDDYLVKPTDKETLTELIEEWLEVLGHEDQREYQILDSKRELLETYAHEHQLSNNDMYANITDRLDALQDSGSVPNES